MPDLPEKSLLRVDEVARFFRVTPRTVYLWIERGKVQSRETPGGGVRIARESLVLFLSTTRTSSVA